MGSGEEVQAIDSPVEHVEVNAELKRDQEVVLKSALDDLGLWATVKRFPKVRSCLAHQV
jgi:hypothetical protein